MHTKEQHRAYMRAWYKSNKEKARKYTERWRLANPEATRAIKRQYYQRNREILRARIRKQELQSLYGLTLDDYHRMLIAQDGRCAICGSPITAKRSLDVDHNHVTQAVRGLLCIHCNRKIAVLEDPQWVKLGMEYLERYV